MVSRNEIKLISSLSQKKYRYKHMMFVAEGVKLVNELLNSSYVVEQIYTTKKQEFSLEENQIKLISEREMEKLSKLSTPSGVIGLFKIPTIYIKVMYC